MSRRGSSCLVKVKRRSNAPCAKFYKLRFLYSEGNFSEDKSVQVTLCKIVKRQTGIFQL